MPIVLEPTSYLNQRLDQLPEAEASRLWQALDRANLQLCRLVKRLEAKYITAPQQRQLERQALNAVARAWQMRPEQLLTADRFSRRVAARGQLITLLHERHGLSYRAIGQLLRRDRSTVAHAHRQHSARMEGRLGAEPDYATRYAQVLQLCPAPSSN